MSRDAKPVPAAPSSGTVTIITTCMGRLAFLKRSLPTWLENTPFSVIVVDYSCPEGAADWVDGAGVGGRVTAVRQPALLHDGRKVFNLSRARNAGARMVDDGYLLFLDADTLVKPGFGEWMAERVSSEVAMAVLSPMWSLFGLLGVPCDAFRAVGGYDEGFLGWGGEDVDMRIRLHLHGMRYVALPGSLLRSIPHSTALRIQNGILADFTETRRITQDYLDRKLVRLTGRSASEWYADPGAGCLASPAGH